MSKAAPKKEQLEQNKDRILAYHETVGRNSCATARKFGVSHTYLRQSLVAWGVLTPKRKKSIVLDKKRPIITTGEHFDQILDLLEKEQELDEAASVLQEEVHCEDDNYVMVVIAGDVHLGSKDTDYARLKEDIQAINSVEGVYVIHVGDLTSSLALMQSKFGLQTEEAALKKQRVLAKGYIEQLPEMLAVVMSGNHDEWYWKAGNMELSEINIDTNAAFFAHEGMIYLRVGEIDYTIHLGHKGKGRSMYNDNHPQAQIIRTRHDADVVVTGHFHTPSIQQKYIRDDQKVVLVSAGSYQKLGKYASSINVKRVGIEMPCVIFSPKEKRLWAFLDFRGEPLEWFEYLRNIHADGVDIIGDENNADLQSKN